MARSGPMTLDIRAIYDQSAAPAATLKHNAGDDHAQAGSSSSSGQPRSSRSAPGRQGPEAPAPRRGLPSPLAPGSGGTPAGLHERRADAPVVRPYTRGSRELAEAIASDPARRQAAADELRRNAFAATASGPRASKTKCWEAQARKCGYPNPYAFTPNMLYEVMGSLHGAGYRSAMGVLSQVKLDFVEEGGCWSPSLQRVFKKLQNACKRGKGPDRHTAAFPLDRAPELPDGFRPDEFLEGAPAFPRRAVIVASWWLTREVEAGNAVVGDVRRSGPSGVTWNLPVSKADTAALGAERTHHCACGLCPGAPAPSEPGAVSAMPAGGPGRVGHCTIWPRPFTWGG